MKLKLKEDPREWRKIAWLTAGGVAFVASILCWRKVLPPRLWGALLVVLAITAIAAWAQPRWFRGFYRISSRVGFRLGQAVGFVLLTGVFLVIVTPFGWVARLAGKDLLRLKRPPADESCWTPSRPATPLDSLF